MRRVLDEIAAGNLDGEDYEAFSDRAVALARRAIALTEPTGAGESR